MIKKIIFIVVFFLIGVIYNDLGLIINGLISEIFPEIRLISFFTPLIVIDFFVITIYLSIVRVIVHKTNTFWWEFFVTLICAISISIFSSFCWVIGRFIIQMDF